MSINTINGTRILVKFGPVGEEVEVFCSTSCTLNINAETTGASCKSGGSWSQSVKGNRSWDVTVDGLYQVSTVNGFVDLSDLIIEDNNEEVSIIIGIDTPEIAGGDEQYYWNGLAICTSVSLTAPDGEIATWSASFSGNGTLKKVAVPAEV